MPGRGVQGDGARELVGSGNVLIAPLLQKAHELELLRRVLVRGAGDGRRCLLETASAEHKQPGERHQRGSQQQKKSCPGHRPRAGNSTGSRDHNTHQSVKVNTDRTRWSGILQ